MEHLEDATYGRWNGIYEDTNRGSRRNSSFNSSERKFCMVLTAQCQMSNV